jgi:hypothetical protein
MLQNGGALIIVQDAFEMRTSLISLWIHRIKSWTAAVVALRKVNLLCLLFKAIAPVLNHPVSLGLSGFLLYRLYTFVFFTRVSSALVLILFLYSDCGSIGFVLLLLLFLLTVLLFLCLLLLFV